MSLIDRTSEQNSLADAVDDDNDNGGDPPTSLPRVRRRGGIKCRRRLHIVPHSNRQTGDLLLSRVHCAGPGFRSVLTF